MNYYRVRGREDGSGYHFTVRNDEQIWPVGYCAEHEPHKTPEQAVECFHRYLLDGQREEEYGDWTGCEVCDTPTKKGLTTRPPLGNGHPLCDEHRTPERLAALEPVPTPDYQITASY